MKQPNTYWQRNFTALLFFMVSLLPVHATENDSIGYFTKIAGRFNHVFPQEKLYLHLDNTGYFIGETLWFKVYQVCSSNDSLGGRSNIAYVELYNATGEMEKQVKVKLNHGVGIGQIKLGDILRGGFFEIRAYTRYMLNWGTDAIFSRTIPIFEKPAKEGDYSSPRLWTPRATDVPTHREKPEGLEKNINAKFYPEGGHLIKGFKSRLAFELFDRQGQRLKAACTLKQGDQTLMRTQTNSDGRGMVFVTPGDTPCTLSVVCENGRTANITLPTAEVSGIALSADMSQKKDNIPVQLSATPDWQGQTVGVTLMNNGKIYFCEEHSLGGKPVSLSLSRRTMKEGVSQLTVIDEHGQILASRMLFVYPHTKMAPINLSVDSVEGRIVRLSAQTLPNTTFSLAVRDAGNQVSGWDQNAASWLLLSSDLKGYIHHAAYYLESDDAEHRQATDLLMLVQGWRRYDFRMMEGKKNFAFDYPIEKQMILNGQIYPTKKKQTVEGIDLTLVLNSYDGDALVGHAKTDSRGRYRFTVPDCWGNGWNMYVKTSKEDKMIGYYVGVSRNFSPKLRGLDPQEMLPLQLPVPPINLQTAIDRGDLSLSTDGVRVLQQVTVTAKRRQGKYFWENYEGNLRTADLIYRPGDEVDELLDKGQAMPTLIEYLKGKNPLLVGSDNVSGYVPYTNTINNYYDNGLSYERRPIMWYVNNHFACATGVTKRIKKPDNADELESITYGGMVSYALPFYMDEVSKVLIKTTSSNINDQYAQMAGNNVVKIFVYRNSQGRYYSKKPKGLRTTWFRGLANPETYEDTELTGIIPDQDYRRTLLWEPNLTTDADGKVSFEVLVNSTCREMYYSAEGITADGRAVVSK